MSIYRDIYRFYRVVDSQEKEVASAMMGAFLGIGLASGAALSLYMVKAL